MGCSGMSEKSSCVDLDDVEHHETGNGSVENCRNRTSSMSSDKNAQSRIEMVSLLRANLPASDNEDDDNDSEFVAHTVVVPSTPVCGDEPPQTSSPFLTTSNNVRRRWTSLKRWFAPSYGQTPAAIRLNELRAHHIRIPVRTDVQNHLCR